MLKFTLAFLAICLATGYATFHSHADDDAAFAKLVQSSDPSYREEAGGLVAYCQQMREGVSKELAFNSHECNLKAKTSELFLFNQNGDFEIIEEFDRVYVTVDDNHIEAQDAWYNYNTNTLSTKEAKLTKQEAIVKSDEAHYDGKQLILIGNVSVDSEMGYIKADKAVIDQIEKDKKITASKITLIGHVRMINGEKTQYALADHVEFFPNENVMIFESEGRVLFYDKVKQMQLSAKKVRAHRGIEDEVQGYGDVRFVFGTEELDRFKKQFKWES